MQDRYDTMKIENPKKLSKLLYVVKNPDKEREMIYASREKLKIRHQNERLSIL